jgi:hypothetical protein
MGDLKRGARTLVRSPGHWFKNQWKSMKEGSRQIGEVLGYEKAGVTPKSDSTKQMLAANAEPVLPIADDEELKRARRRRAGSTQRTSRASTILSSNEDTLG